MRRMYRLWKHDMAMCKLWNAYEHLLETCTTDPKNIRSTRAALQLMFNKLESMVEDRQRLL